MLRIMILALALILSAPALAKPAAKPSLDSLQSELKTKKAEQSRLAKEASDAEKELNATRKELKDTAARARESEQALSTLERRIAALSAEQEELGARLQNDYGSMAGLIVALERLRRVPPEALVIRPGAPLETAQTALLLQSILPVIDRRADRLAADLKRLKEVTASLESDRAAALEARDALAGKYREIEKLAATREKLYREVNGNYRETAAAVEKIAREAKSMRDLMERLEQERQAQRKTAASSATTPRRSRAAEDMPRPGHPRLPVAGMILIGFGQKDLIGADSKGLTIETPPGALVLAPLGGIVRYTGSFKNYGKMIILEHKGSWHSLIAHLGEINVAIGQSLEAGEPLGKLPSSSSRGDKPALYYELRHKGRPVNPSEKFPDLKS